MSDNLNALKKYEKLTNSVINTGGDYEKFIKNSTINMADKFYKKATSINTKNSVKRKLFSCYGNYTENNENVMEYLWAAADIYKNKKLYNKEFKCYEKIISILKNSVLSGGTEYFLIVAYSYSAECMENIDYVKAIDIYKIIINIYQGRDDISNVIRYKRQIADVYKKHNDKDNSIKYYEDVLGYYKTMNYEKLQEEIIGIINSFV